MDDLSRVQRRIRRIRYNALRDEISLKLGFSKEIIISAISAAAVITFLSFMNSQNSIFIYSLTVVTIMFLTVSAFYSLFKSAAMRKMYPGDVPKHTLFGLADICASVLLTIIILITDIPVFVYSEVPEKSFPLTQVIFPMCILFLVVDTAHYFLGSAFGFAEKEKENIPPFKAVSSLAPAAPLKLPVTAAVLLVLTVLMWTKVEYKNAFEMIFTIEVTLLFAGTFVVMVISFMASLFGGKIPVHMIFGAVEVLLCAVFAVMSFRVQNGSYPIDTLYETLGSLGVSYYTISNIEYDLYNLAEIGEIVLIPLTAMNLLTACTLWLISRGRSKFMAVLPLFTMLPFAAMYFSSFIVFAAASIAAETAAGVIISQTINEAGADGKKKITVKRTFSYTVIFSSLFASAAAMYLQQSGMFYLRYCNDIITGSVISAVFIMFFVAMVWLNEIGVIR